MRLLLDTHLLLWAAAEPHKLSKKAAALILDQQNELIFSAISLWEVSIKTGRGHPDFNVEPSDLRHNLNANGYHELAFAGRHAIAVRSLPDIHKDPFDRALVAQAAVEQVTFVTVDTVLATYPASILTV
jgi:PIN domain nuclease of toxin-antitoxin system